MSGIPAWAVPGAKVVCVDGSDHYVGPDYHDYISPRPIEKQVYVVAGTSWGDRVTISGLPNTGIFGGDYGWCPTRFRPIVSRSQEQDTAMFRKIASNLPSAKDMEPAIDEALARLDLP